MNLEVEILKEHSKRQTTRISRWIGADKRKFKKLVELFLNGEYRVTQRSAWIISVCAEKHPGLIRPHLKSMVARMQEPGTHDAVRRSVLRILKFVDIPRDLKGTIATLCFGYLESATKPIAVKAFSMVVLAKIARVEPDLQRELRLVIGQQLPFGGPAIKSSAGQALKLIDSGRIPRFRRG